MPRKQKAQSSRSNDMFANLLDNPIPNYSPTGSSSNPQPNNPNTPPIGFSSYVPLQNPFSIPQDNPHRDFLLNQYHQQQQFNQHPPYGQYGSYQPYGGYPQTPTTLPQFYDVQTPPPVREEEADFQPETQPETQPGKKDKGKRRKVQWSDLESRILAERWVHASENPTQGNSQTAEGFWQSIQASYNALVDTPRTMDQLTGKWSRISKEVKFFNAIYKKLEEMWESGNGDADIMSNARKLYKQQQNKQFAYEDAWRVLRDFPKFLFPEGVSRNKRPVREQEAVNLSDEDAVPSTNPAQMHELFRNDPIRRPPGRDTSRKSQRSSGSSDAASSARYSLEQARDEFVETAKEQRETLAAIKAAANKRTMFEAFKFLATPIPSNLPPADLELLNKAREQIRREYSSHFGDN